MKPSQFLWQYLGYKLLLSNLHLHLNHRIHERNSGPTFDGRIKPDLVAFGQDGSSGAAALVSGVSTLLQQQYANQRSGVRPSASLIKALLLNILENGRSEQCLKY